MIYIYEKYFDWNFLYFTKIVEKSQPIWHNKQKIGKS